MSRQSGLDAIGGFDESPIITTADVVAYRQADHTITLTDSAVRRVDQLLEPFGGFTFVACVGRERIYAGAFTRRGFLPSFVGIVMRPINHGQVQIQLSSGVTDRRGDSRILQAMQRARKLE